MIDLAESKITGTQIAYYIVCKRKLWLFSNKIEMEKYSDYVNIGKLISEDSFKREKFKEIEIGDTIKIDFIKINDEVIIHEIKKSRSLEEAHIWQVKFYIYSLKKLRVNCDKGTIHYPKLMRKVDVRLNDEDISFIEKTISEIKTLLKGEVPSVINKPYCKKCAYYEFCYL